VFAAVERASAGAEGAAAMAGLAARAGVDAAQVVLCRGALLLLFNSYKDP
jgi:hypothetical protein